MATDGAGDPKAAHNVGEREGLQALKAKIAATLRSGPIRCVRVADAAPDATQNASAGAKKVHFIRHGEGHHNVAQREWRARPDWDGISEPYTPDNDPDSRYEDAELTERGVGQARDLQPRTAGLEPELLVVSPMRRATQTALIAFERHVSSGALKVVAHELCHERAGKHTCDRRLPTSRLQAAFPQVDYGLIEAEDDPYWDGGFTRESLEQLAHRCALFVEWIMSRPERHIAVAAHSAFLLGVFNAVLDCGGDQATSEHFGTGEMRTVLLTPSTGSPGRRREAPGIRRGSEPYMSVDGSAPPPRDYVILEQLTFAVPPVSITMGGQTFPVQKEQYGYMARRLTLPPSGGELDAVLQFEDGSQETIVVKLENVC